MTIANSAYDNGDDNAQLASGGTAADKPWGRETCWDEARMVVSMWQWAMAQRYPCLADIKDCQPHGDPVVFANSIKGGG